MAARKEGGLEELIKQAEAAAGNPFKGFLTGVRRDYAAVEFESRFASSCAT